MCDSYSSVWLEVGLPRHKKFLVGQTYREWQLPNQNDKSSLSVPEQLARWSVFQEQWERALDTGLEVHLRGDLNINHSNWTQDPPCQSQIRPLNCALSSTLCSLAFFHKESLSVWLAPPDIGQASLHQVLITTILTNQTSSHQSPLSTVEALTTC